MLKLRFLFMVSVYYFMVRIYFTITQKSTFTSHTGLSDKTTTGCRLALNLMVNTNTWIMIIFRSGTHCYPLNGWV